MADENILSDWPKRIITGMGGMQDYEDYEKVVWNEDIRIAAAKWTLRCLANPKCKGSEQMIQQILQARTTSKDAPDGQEG